MAGTPTVTLGPQDADIGCRTCPAKAGLGFEKGVYGVAGRVRVSLAGWVVAAADLVVEVLDLPFGGLFQAYQRQQVVGLLHAQAGGDVAQGPAVGIEFGVDGRLSRFCADWMTKTIRKVTVLSPSW